MKQIIQTAFLLLLPCSSFAQQIDPSYWTNLEARVRTNKFAQIQPLLITNLPAHPTNWTEVSLHNVSFQLPLTMIHSVSNRAALLVQFFGSDDFSVNLAKITSPQDVSFAQQKRTETVSLQDLDQSSTEGRNEILVMLEQKTIKAEGTFNIRLVETHNLNAVVQEVWMPGKGRKNHLTSCDVYSPNDQVGFLMIIMNEPNDQFVLQVLDGISFHGSTMERNRIIADIEKIQQTIKDRESNKFLHGIDAKRVKP